ncbi:unnamed protein product [Agarophyton chilense]
MNLALMLPDYCFEYFNSLQPLSKHPKTFQTTVTKSKQGKYRRVLVMEGDTIAQVTATPNRTINGSSAFNRSVPGINPSFSFGPTGIPNASSITRSPLAFISEDGDFGVLDMFVDSKDFELHETVRSLRFTAASTNISHLFPLTPKSGIMLPPSSLSSNNLLEQSKDVEVGKTFRDHYHYGQLDQTKALPTDESEEGGTALKMTIVKPLSAEALTKARCEIDALEIEPFTPLGAPQNEVSELEVPRAFSLSARSRNIFEKLSILRDKRLPTKTEERNAPRVDDERTAASTPQPLSKLASGLERLFSRISNSSKPHDQSDVAPLTGEPSFHSNLDSRSKMKAKLTKWKDNIGKFLGYSS